MNNTIHASFDIAKGKPRASRTKTRQKEPSFVVARA
jgi:hypothetical protein